MSFQDTFRQQCWVAPIKTLLNNMASQAITAGNRRLRISFFLDKQMADGRKPMTESSVLRLLTSVLRQRACSSVG